jgi:hypothetical protein
MKVLIATYIYVERETLFRTTSQNAEVPYAPHVSHGPSALTAADRRPVSIGRMGDAPVQNIHFIQGGDGSTWRLYASFRKTRLREKTSIVEREVEKEKYGKQWRNRNNRRLQRENNEYI